MVPISNARHKKCSPRWMSQATSEKNPGRPMNVNAIGDGAGSCGPLDARRHCWPRGDEFHELSQVSADVKMENATSSGLLRDRNIDSGVAPLTTSSG
jgi:hypothetical protein